MPTKSCKNSIYLKNFHVKLFFQGIPYWVSQEETRKKEESSRRATEASKRREKEDKTRGRLGRYLELLARGNVSASVTCNIFVIHMFFFEKSFLLFF